MRKLDQGTAKKIITELRTVSLEIIEKHAQISGKLGGDIDLSHALSQIFSTSTAIRELARVRLEMAKNPEFDEELEKRRIIVKLRIEEAKASFDRMPSDVKKLVTEGWQLIQATHLVATADKFISIADAKTRIQKFCR